MNKSKRIKNLENKISEMQAILDILIASIGNNPTKSSLDSGKWYKEQAIDK
jgi:hypothetical protein